MKKQFEVVHASTIAFDNHHLTLKAPDATVQLHLHDSSEFDALKPGDTVTLTLSTDSEKSEAPKKAAAPKKKAQATA